MRTIELLAPAGSMECFKAAVNAGADAVYIGGTRFGARAYAENLTEEDMKWAIDYAHLHGVSLYMTINTLLKDKELEEELYDYVKPYYEHGLDAVIVQDLGVLSALSGWFPDLPIHVSTQMTVTGPEGFSFLKQFPNVTRVVTSRELSLEEIQQIRNTTDLEIESFIHGALCYCYSGQCLFSSVIGGRSGNRGRCAQPCRLPYDVIDGEKCISGKQEKYILSPKDLSTLSILQNVLDAGIDSLKIEGRMKRPEYTAGVVSIYRKYIDQYLENNGKELKISKKDLQDLEELFRKRGYTNGYYVQHNGRDMMSLSAPENEKSESERNVLMEELYEKYVKTEKKEKIKGILRVSTKSPIKLLLQWKHHQVEITTEPAMVPKNRAMTEADFEKQMKKTGNTPFVFEDLQILLEDEVFVPNSVVNELRRSALEQLEQLAVSEYRRVAPAVERLHLQDAQDSKSSAEPWEPVVSVSVETMEQLEAVGTSGFVKNLYIDSSLMSMTQLEVFYASEKGRKLLENFEVYYILPAIFRKKTAEAYTKEYLKLESIFWKGFVVKNLEGYEWLRKMKNQRPIVIDANLYTFNRRSKAVWRMQEHISYETLPLELNFKELKRRGCEEDELFVYGRLPMMISAGCVYKSLNQCKKANNYLLKDRKNMKFPVKPVCRECYNVIYNSQPLSLLNLQKEVNALRPASLRIAFTVENARQVTEVLKRFETNMLKGKTVEDLPDFTRGHFKRGVE